MRTDSQNVIDLFDALPLHEQQEVLAQLLRRPSQWDSSPLTDDDLARMADEQFLELDRSEETTTD